MSIETGRAARRGAALLAAAAVSTGCAWFAKDLHGTREQARPLALGERHPDLLHCDARECNDWYQLELARASEVSVRVFAPVGRGLPDYSLRLEDAGGNVLRVTTGGPAPRELREHLASGRYYVLVAALGPDDEPMRYEILAEPVVPPPPPPPVTRPEPRLVPVHSEVLEVERDRGEPAYVLIRAGKAEGLTPGLGGALVLGGREIARIQIVEVFDAGSRARIVGPLADSITFETEARFEITVVDERSPPPAY